MNRITFTLACIIASASALFGQSTPSVSILGDSYSTFEGYLSPSSNSIWYFADPQRDLTDVEDVTETWWHLLISEGGYRLERNNSFSGSTVCNTGYKGADYTDRSFITRMDDLGSPDVIFIFGATNDSWANVPLGEVPASVAHPSAEELYSFRPALAYMLSHMQKRYPNTRIIYLINDGLKPEITSSIIEACDTYGIPYVELQGISKTAGHPNRAGMRQIADQVAPLLSAPADKK